MPLYHMGFVTPRGAVRGAGAVLCVLLTGSAARPAAAGVQTWTGTGPRAKSVYGLARDPLTPTRMWAASFGSGIYRTLDGGTTWTPSRTGLANTFTRCVAVNPHQPDSLFCGTNDGIYGSVDGGATWVELLPTPVSVRAIAWHPVKTAIAYAATYGDGVYKTTNGGATWSVINTGLVNTDVRDIALHPTKPDTLLAGTGTAGGLHQSLNGGLTWKQLGDNLAKSYAVAKIQYDLATPSTAYAALIDQGVIRTTNGGVTWQSLNAGLPTLQCRSLSVVDTLRYVGTDSGGVYVSGAKNTTWRAANTGLSNLYAETLLSVQGAGSTVWVGTDGGGVAKTTNQGGLWTPFDGGLLNTSAFALAVRTTTPTHTVYDAAGFGDQFWRSGDQAATWTRDTYLFTHDSERAVVVDPVAPATVYMTAYGSGVYRSLDDGATWSYPDSLTQTMTNQSVRSLVAYPGQSGHLFVGNGIGVYESTNGGSTWTSRVGDLPPSFGVHALALVPGAPVTLYAGNDSLGVYKTTDGGVTWTARNAGLQSLFIHDLLIDADNVLNVFAATDSGVFVSTDGALSWTKSSAGLPSGATGIDARALVQDPAHHNVLFCGMYGAGVYESIDHGATWTSLVNQSGLASLVVRSLAIDGTAGILYVGHDAGVQQVSGYPAVVAVGDPGTPRAPELHLTAHRGAAGAWTLALTLPAAGRVTLEVLDVRGRVLRSVTAGEMSAGPHALEWQAMGRDGRRLSSGIYWIRATSGGQSRAARVAVFGR